MTRVDAVSLGIVVNKHAERFYDEGEDFWPKRYAIWGRLVAGQPDQIAFSIIDAKSIGKFMPPVYPPITARSIPELAAMLALDAAALDRTIADFNAAVRPGTFDHTMLDDCRTEGLEPPKTHWARPIDTPPFYAYPLRPGITFTYLGVAIDETARMILQDGKPAANIFAAGEIMAGNVLGQGLPRRDRHGDRHDVRTHRGRGGRAPCPRLSAPRLQELIAEAQRVLTICNACRYCEGYCAVFPALERRLAFDESDVHYLANLCHNCGACLYACQYAPPHEFKLNFPRVLAQVRKETYKKYAWPGFLASAFERNGAVVSIVTMLSLALFFLFTAWYADPARFFPAHPDAQGSFYAVLPHGVMAGVFGVVFAFVILVFVIGFVRFWRDTGERVGEFVRPGSLGSATWDAAGLKYLDGGGDGCTYPGREALVRAAQLPPPDVLRLPAVLRGDRRGDDLPLRVRLEGAVRVLQPAGDPWHARRARPARGSRRVAAGSSIAAIRSSSTPAQTGMDAGFLVLLFVTSLTGLLLLAFRETRAMGVLLALHLGAVMALFLTLPYGKFVHALYRFAALVRFHVERRRPLSEIAAE